MKINSKWAMYLNVKHKTLRKTIIENLLDLGLGFLNLTPKAQSTKGKKIINWLSSKLNTPAL